MVLPSDELLSLRAYVGLRVSFTSLSPRHALVGDGVFFSSPFSSVGLGLLRNGRTEDLMILSVPKVIKRMLRSVG